MEKDFNQIHDEGSLWDFYLNTFGDAMFFENKINQSDPNFDTIFKVKEAQRRLNKTNNIVYHQYIIGKIQFRTKRMKKIECNRFPIDSIVEEKYKYQCFNLNLDENSL